MPGGLRHEDISFLLDQLAHDERLELRRRFDRRRNVIEFRDAVIEWLEARSFDLLAHLTAREMRTETVARKLLNRWQMKISRKSWGQNFWKRGEGVNGIAVISPQGRGDLHIHTVVGNTNNLDPQVAQECWNRRHFHRADVDDTLVLTVTRLAKVDWYHPGGGGIRYLANHLGLGDDDGGTFVIFGSWLDG